mgnify:CR=1 FL=1
MTKRLTVEDWLNVILPTGEKIETVVRYGPDIVCRAESPSWLSSHGPLGVLEARVMSVGITIQAKPKDITV